MSDTFVFNVLSKPEHEQQTARVICMHPDVDDCFKVRENGVEGTVIQMPDACDGPSWSRAVSLTLSRNQSVPSNFVVRGPTSAVFDYL